MLTSTQLTTLKTFLTADAHALGIAAHLTTGDVGAVANIMNTVQPSSAGWAQVNNEPVSPSDVVAAITPADFAAMTLDQKQSLIVLETIPLLDLSVAGVLTNLKSCFQSSGDTVTAIQAMSKRAGRPGEVLFGNGVLLTANDISNAMSS
jgi:hypothetical protein